MKHVIHLTSFFFPPASGCEPLRHWAQASSPLFLASMCVTAETCNIDIPAFSPQLVDQPIDSNRFWSASRNDLDEHERSEQVGAGGWRVRSAITDLTRGVDVQSATGAEWHHAHAHSLSPSLSLSFGPVWGTQNSRNPCVATSNKKLLVTSARTPEKRRGELPPYATWVEMVVTSRWCKTLLRWSDWNVEIFQFRSPIQHIQH